jgi:hypothetical protein
MTPALDRVEMNAALARVQLLARKRSPDALRCLAMCNLKLDLSLGRISQDDFNFATKNPRIAVQRLLSQNNIQF